MNELLVPAGAQADELKNPEFQRQVNKLRQVDNVTNWFYLVREYIYLTTVLGAALAFYHFHGQWGLSWLWTIPVTLIAIVLVGLGQHRLVMLAHEASHYLLFKNLTLNELVSNWFCLYPVWSMTYNYRLQHLAHHQHTNHPEKDPDLVYMEVSGHRFNYPMPLGKFFWECVVKLFFWIPGLVRNVFIRAYLANQGGSIDPYKAKRKSSKLLSLVHLLYLATLLVLVGAGALTNDVRFLLLAPIGLLSCLFVFTLFVPDHWYLRTGVKPSIAPRWASFQRLVFVTLLFTALAWLMHWTGRPWPLYYALLWLVPLGTVFSYLMLLREEIQHSNTPQGKYIDSRNFEGNALLKWAVFPYQQGYHLPHHLFPFIPHYNLPALDRLLRTTKVYREKAVVVDGRLFPHSTAECRAV